MIGVLKWPHGSNFVLEWEFHEGDQGAREHHHYWTPCFSRYGCVDTSVVLKFTK